MRRVFRFINDSPHPNSKRSGRISGEKTHCYKTTKRSRRRRDRFKNETVRNGLFVSFRTQAADSRTGLPHFAFAQLFELLVQLFAVIRLAVRVDRTLRFVTGSHFGVQFLEHRSRRGTASTSPGRRAVRSSSSWRTSSPFRFRLPTASGSGSIPQRFR